MKLGDVCRVPVRTWCEVRKNEIRKQEVEDYLRVISHPPNEITFRSWRLRENGTVGRA